MLDSEQVAVECRVYTRYLTGQLPDAYIRRKYKEIFQSGHSLYQDRLSRFDALLIRLAVIHPLFTRAVDAFSRVFYPNSELRKRLVMLAAILEVKASTADGLDCPDKSGNTAFILFTTMQLAVFAILLGIATLFLLPFMLLPRKPPVKS